MKDNNPIAIFTDRFRADGALIFFGIVTLLFFSGAAITNVLIHGEQEYTFVAKSLLRGSVAFVEQPDSVNEAVFMNGHLFSSHTLFPAIVLMPFVAVFEKLFHIFFYQGYLQIFLTAGIFAFCILLARKFGFRRQDTLILAFAFCFASVYQLIAFIPWSWYFAQALAVVLLFGALYEHTSGNRPFILGLCCAGLLLTRPIAGFAALFFFADVFCSRTAIRQKMKRLAVFMMPIGIALALMLAYNAARFGDPLESGYRLAGNATNSEKNRFELLQYGLFQLRNIPTNIYWYFIKSPDPIRLPVQSSEGQTYILKAPYIQASYPGIGFFFVAPVFFWAIRADIRKRIVRLSLIPIGATLMALLAYYWPGWRQVGPRYTLDFLPFAYLLLLHSFPEKRLSKPFYVVVIISACLDLYFLFNAFFVS